jgi:hypothetical protein
VVQGPLFEQLVNEVGDTAEDLAREVERGMQIIASKGGVVVLHGAVVAN